VILVVLMFKICKLVCRGGRILPVGVVQRQLQFADRSSNHFDEVSSLREDEVWTMRSRGPRQSWLLRGRSTAAGRTLLRPTILLCLRTRSVVTRRPVLSQRTHALPWNQLCLYHRYSLHAM